MSNIRMLREHAPHMSTDSIENRLRERGMWPMVERIAKAYYVLPREIIEHKSRYTQEVSRARAALFATIASETEYSAKSIGILFDTEHTTVKNAIDRHKRRTGTTGA